MNRLKRKTPLLKYTKNDLIFMRTGKEHFPVWAEIDLGAIAHNIKAVRQLIPSKTKIMAVVKADAYGHGIVNVAHTVGAAGADAFGVARLGEAVVLRKSGFKNQILIFGYTPPEAAGVLVKNELSADRFFFVLVPRH